MHLEDILKYWPIIVAAGAVVAQQAGIFWKLHGISIKMDDWSTLFKGHTHDPETGDVIVRLSAD